MRSSAEGDGRWEDTMSTPTTSATTTNAGPRHVVSRISQNFGQAIRAELIGSNACSALGITARGHAPVLSLCQLLIEGGHDPKRALLAYRGDTLCLLVRSIVEGAALAVENDRRGTPRFRRRRALSDGAAPYVAQIRKARV